MKQIFLDYAAATPIAPEVLKAMQPYFSEEFYNPSASYQAGRNARQALENARASAARNLGVRPAEIIFTAGGTEANNLALQGIMRQYPGGELLISSIEHDSVREPARLFKHKEISVSPQGIVDLDKLSGAINDNTVMISLIFVSNELGTIQPLREVANLFEKLRRQRLKKGNELPLVLHTDAAQAPNYLDLQVSRLGVDMMSVNGGKIYGPKQTGFLYIRRGIKLAPLILGGGQESNLRSGTENVAGAVGLVTALDLAKKLRSAEQTRARELREDFISALNEKIPKARINGSSKNQSPHIISLTIPGIDNERLMIQLDEEGVQVATGSACSASSREPSHVLSAIGMNPKDAHSTLRISLGRQTTEVDVRRAAELIYKFASVSKLPKALY